ncbi:MAG: hypothetical protein L6R40_001630 [Gallowayella cf. fulva]|nr:MAG: hypothetical protein L6R40_001630 [Xanthomendoza cf. fulva]
MASLISTYRALDQVSEAGTLNQEPLDIYTISLGCADDTTLHHAAIKANILYEQERYSEAAALKLDIFATRVSSLSLYDPKTLEAKENLSKTYLAEGRYAKAAAYAEKVLEAREKADELDTDKDMIATIENLKDIYIAAGRPDDATVMARREDVAKQGS